MKRRDSLMNEMDDLFRSTLGNYKTEPAEDLWKGINRKLLWSELLRFNFTNVSKGYIITGAAIIAVIVGLFFLFPSKKQVSRIESFTINESVSGGQRTTSGQMVQADAKSQMPALSGGKPESNSVSVTGKGQHSDHISSVTRMNTPTHRSGSGTGKKSPVLASKSAYTTLASAAPAGTTRLTESTLTSSISAPVNSREEFLKFAALSCNGLLPGDEPDTMITLRTPEGIMHVRKSKPGLNQSLSADLGITPEMISYKTTSSYTEMNYWLNTNFTYHFSRFSLRTGVGLGYMFDEGKYETKYISKDSIGYFTSVISFYVNPENHNEIIFNTKNIAVYDSLQHFTDDRTRNRYTYLEIPLLIGYQLFESRSFSMDIMAGPAFTFLIGTRKADPYIDYPNSRIVRIDDKTPERQSFSWKFAVGIHLEYRVTKNLGCYVEPFYKYYFTSLTKTETTSAKDPYSIGVGLGIRYHFGLKTK